MQYTDNDVGPPRTELGFNNSDLYISSKTNLLFMGNKIVPMLPYINYNFNREILKKSSFARHISYKLNIILLKNYIFENREEYSHKYIKEISSLAKKNKIPFIIIHFPPASWAEDYCGETISSYGGAKAHDKLRKLSKEIGVKYINMCDYVESIHDIKLDIEPEDGCHYNAKGYELATRILEKEIINIFSK